MDGNDEKSPVVCERSNSMVSIILNRPERLNSLNQQMIEAIIGCLQEALVDEKCKSVLFYGRGKAFCSGGDVKETAQWAKEKAYGRIRSSFAREYFLDLMIHNCPKPVIVLADGITMGGGLGIAAGADIVIATERTRMAMPETKIGFFPDIGATGWLFLKCPEGYPEYLGLTGYDMQAKECVRIGLATNYLNSADSPALIKSLAQYKPGSAQSKEALLTGIKKHIEHFFDFNIPSNPDMDSWVQQYFSGKDDLNDILTSLSSCTLQTKLCDDVFTSIAERSPTALVLTLKLLRHNEGRPLLEVFASDLKAAEYLVRHADFIEGVRARLLDKDNRPHWSPDKIADVSLTGLNLH